MNDEKKVVPSSILIEDENVCLGMPIILGRNGVEDVKQYDLTEKEKQLFKEAATAMRANLAAVGY